MSDLFHELVPESFVADVFAVMGETSRHTFQILTKRPERTAGRAVNQSYMAEQLSLFGIVGIALILSGIGFLVLAIGGALRHFTAAETRGAKDAAVA